MLQQVPHVAYWNLIIGALSILILFVCLLIMHVYLKKDTQDPSTDFESFTQACKSNQITYCGLALCFTSAAMILDVIIDCFDRRNASSESSLIHSSHIWLGRCFYSIGTLMVGIQYALQYDYFHIFSVSDYYLSFWFATYCQRIIMMSATLFFVSISDNDFVSSTFRKTILVNILGCTVLVSHFVFQQFVITVKNYNSLFGYFMIPNAAFTIFSFILISHHIYQIWKTRDTWKVHNYAHFLYVSLLIFMIMIAPLSGITVIMIIRKFEYTAMLTANYSYVAITIILTVIPGRIARRDAMVSKDNIIATKESYVRYLSHEMRTPMNIMHSGIKLAIDEISKKAAGCTELNTEEHLDTLVDVKDACETALEILDDFLLYDKLRNGKVELQKKVVFVFDFVSKCLKSFSLPLRSKNIKLQFLNHDNSVYTLPSNSCTGDSSESKIKIQSSSINDASGDGFINNITSSFISRNTVQNENENFSYIRNNDDMCIDESKLSQVIRNLLSNAIKFTPDKGNIQVTMGFVPDIIAEVSHEMSSIQTTVADYLYGILLNTSSRLNWSSLINRRNAGSDYSLVNNTPALDTQTADIETGNPLLNTLSDVSNDEIVYGMLRIEIQDSGAGISPENQTRLFKEVVQFDPDVLQAGGGSGMGLFISKDLADMHDGRISVYSEGVGKGTTFLLEIPMHRHTQQNYQSSSMLSLETSSSLNPSVSFNTTSAKMASTSLPSINSLNDVTEVIVNTNENESTTQQSQDNVSSPILYETQSKVLSNVTISSNSTNNMCSPLHGLSEIIIESEQQNSAKKLKSPRLMKSLVDSTTIESIQVSVPRKCLVVDDVATSRKMLIKYLKGHYCDQAADGDIAVDMVKAIIMVVSEVENTTSSSSSSAAMITAANLPVDSPFRNYDIIFMDYVMPNMKGPVATKAIRDLGYTGLIYGVTGNGLPVDIATFMAAGATDVIIKPFRKEDLLRIGLFAPDSA